MPNRPRNGPADVVTSRRKALQSLGGLAGLATIAGCLSRSPDAGSGKNTTTGSDDTSMTAPAFADWTYETPHDDLGAITLAPMGDPSTAAVYVGSGVPSGEDTRGSDSGHRLYALSLQDGTEQWQLSLPNAMRTTPMYGGDDGPARLYFATGPESLHGEDVTFHAVDPAKGEQAWTFTTEKRRFLYPLTTTDDAVFVGRRDDQLSQQGEFLYALDAADGHERWRIESGDAARDGHATRRGTLFVQTQQRLRALDPATGEERWRVEADQSLHGPAYANDGDRVFVGHDGVVRALAREDGSEHWRREFDFTISRVTLPRAALSDTVFVGDYDGRLLALSPLDGETRWTLPVDQNQFYPRIERTSERLFLGGAGVHALDPVSGKREWSFMAESESAVDVHASTTVFAHDARENSLYALDPESGKKRWQFAPDREIVGPATAGSVAFVAAGGVVFGLDGSA